LLPKILVVGPVDSEFAPGLGRGRPRASPANLRKLRTKMNATAVRINQVNSGIERNGNTVVLRLVPLKISNLAESDL